MKKSFFFKTALALFLSVGLLGLMVTGCKPLSGPDSTSFTVTFDSDGGSAVEPQTVKEGEFALRPESPEKEGYNFVDWFAPDATAAFDFGTPITADITLKAKWSIISYTVKFDSDGGSDVAPAIVEYGKTVTKPTDPVKDGFFFAGWYTDKELTKKFNFDTEIKSNITLFAKWSSNPVYAITLKLNYDGTEDLKEEADSDGSYKITEPAPERKGYKLLGWYTDDKFTTKWDFANAFTEDTVLYAKWEIIQYSIKYELDGGTNYTDAPVTYTIETATITLGTPTKAGSAFKGWYKEAAKTNKIETIEKGSTGDITVYAKWISAENTAKNGKLTISLSQYNDFSETENGIVWTFDVSNQWADYPVLFKIEKAKIDKFSADYDKVEVIADVYDENGEKVDIASNYEYRISVQAGPKDPNYADMNLGVAGSYAIIDATEDYITIGGKEKKLSKVVIKKITLIDDDFGAGSENAFLKVIADKGCQSGAEWSASDNAIVWTFDTSKTWANYPWMVRIAKADIPEFDTAWNQVEVIADVYDEKGDKVDIASDWDMRIAVDAGGTANFNMGVAGQYADFGTNNEYITIQGKDKVLSKVVIKQINFSTKD